MKRILPLFAALVACSAAYAHEAHPVNAPTWKYDGFCCSGSTAGVPQENTGDCQKIDKHTVRAVQGGWKITLEPGDHHMVTRPHTFTIPQSQVRRSLDDDFHLCLYPTEDTWRCLYQPDMSF